MALEAIWITLLPLFIAVWLEWQQLKEWGIQCQTVIIKRRRRKGKAVMIESLRQFIGKECAINVMGVNVAVVGVVEGLEENWLLVRGTKNPVGPQMISMEYVSRILEVPLNKNGKRKLGW